MTIAVAANLSDGVILGADSAITIQGRAELPQGVQQGVLKVYNEAEKVFQLCDLPIGITSYGLAMIGKRTIESYVREFEGENDNKAQLPKDNLGEIAEKLRNFLDRKYKEIVKPALESELKLPYENIPLDKKPLLGMVLAGYSPSEHLSEVWEIQIPFHQRKEDLKLVREKGNFGTNWFGQYFGITRFVKGFDPALVNDVINFVIGKYGITVNNKRELETELSKVMEKHEYRIPFDAMPLTEGIEHVRFLLDIVINQHRFVIGAPVCGGNLRMVAITKNKFKSVLPEKRLYD